MRRMYAGGLALLLALPLTAAAQDTVSQKEHQTTVRNLEDTQQRLYTLQTELSNARLQQMAMLVNLATQGKDRLLLGSGIVANPKLGKIPIEEGGEGNAPFVTFYPVSEPRSVSLADVGVCEIQGVVRLSVGAYRSEKNTCKAGSYLLALKTDANGGVSLPVGCASRCERPGSLPRRLCRFSPIASREPTTRWRSRFQDRRRFRRSIRPGR